jgi:hypothetical protein
LFWAFDRSRHLQPLFNKIAPLNNPKITTPILSLARQRVIKETFMRSTLQTDHAHEREREFCQYHAHPE